MNSVAAWWRLWKYGRRFAKIGKGCRFVGRHLDVRGHVEIGDFCRFRDNCVLRADGQGKILIGDRFIASYSCIIEAAELVQIGNRTAMTEFVVVRDTTHLIRGTDAQWTLAPHIVKPVIIGEGCWIGSGAYIGPGVTIGDGAVIGARAVVTKDVGPFEVWAGVPARFLYHRTKDVPPEIQAEADRLIAEQGIRPDRYEGR